MLINLGPSSIFKEIFPEERKLTMERPISTSQRNRKAVVKLIKSIGLHSGYKLLQALMDGLYLK